MDENLYVNSNTRIIARNNMRFMATNDKNITINDINSKAFIIDENGNIVSDNVLIGPIIKLGYWNIENTTFELLKNKLFIYKNIVNAFLGMSVSEMIMIIDNIFCNDSSLKLNSETLNLILSKYDFDISGVITNVFISDVNADESCNVDYETIINDFIMNLSQFKKYNLQYENVVKIVDQYTNALTSVVSKILKLLPLVFDYLFNKTIEKRNKIIEYDDASEVDKIICLICSDYIRNFLESNNKKEAFYRLSLRDYNEFFSRDTIDSFKELIEFDFQNINIFFEKEQLTCAQNLIVIFNSILMGNNYLETILQLQNSKVNNILNIILTGLMAGIIYQESGIPDDMLVNLDVEEEIRRIANISSQKIYNDLRL